MISATLLAGSTLLALASSPPSAGKLRADIQGYVARHEREILEEFRNLLAIPNLASNEPGIRTNARAIVAMFEKRGVRTQLLEDSGAPPAVFGELESPGAKKTVVFYAHYDGQPVVASDWKGDPWKPVIRDGPVESGGKEIPWDPLPASTPPEARIYARSAGDDKAPIIGFLAALDALEALGVRPSVNLKFFIEGEEEAGSPHLAEFLRAYRPRLSADAWIFCDGPIHQSRRMLIFFGARGIVDVELTVYGPTRPLHSGHYGNWAPNPIALLTDLLASIRDPNGRILIPGFLEDVSPLTETERRAVAEMPNNDADLERELGIGRAESPGPLAEAILAPAVNFRGIEGGHVGEKATNAIPTEARASIDFRLVPNQTPDGVHRRVEDFVAMKGFFIVRDEPDLATRLAHEKLIRMNWGPGYPAERTSLDAPLSRAVVRIAEEATGGPVVRMPGGGGSIPMYVFRETLGAPVIGVPIANHDDNQHAANENLRLQNLWDGITVYAELFALLGKEWK